MSDVRVSLRVQLGLISMIAGPYWCEVGTGRSSASAEGQKNLKNLWKILKVYRILIIAIF